MGKKLNSFEDLGGFVFSTNSDMDLSSEEESIETLPPNQQLLKLHFEKKGRNGKTVCIVRDFIGTEEDLKTLGKQLKQHCGVGGSVKDGEIIIQGNVRDKIVQYLEKKNYKYKKIGG